MLHKHLVLILFTFCSSVIVSSDNGRQPKKRSRTTQDDLITKNEKEKALQKFETFKSLRKDDEAMKTIFAGLNLSEKK